MYGRPRPFFGGLSGGLFLIFLALAFMSHGYFLPLLFVGLAFSALFGSLSSGKPQAAYGGIQGFIWMLGLAVIFAFDFWWPGILILIGISAILGALFRPMVSGAVGAGMMGANRSQQPYYQPSQEAQQPYYQPSQPQPSYQPYQEGYQPQSQQETYQEGGKVHTYQPPTPDYEQPQAQYPQELPPQQ